MTIQQRLVLSVVVVFVVIGAATALLDAPVRRSQHQIRDLHEREVQYASTLHHACEHAELAMMSYIVTRKPQYREEFDVSLRRMDVSIKALRASPRFGKHVAEEREVLDTVVEWRGTMETQANSLFRQMETTTAIPPREGFIASVEKCMDAAQQLQRIELVEQSKAIDTLDVTLADLEQWNWATSLLGLVLAATVAYGLGRSILLPVRSLTDAATRITNGDLDAKVEVGGEGEIRRLAETFEDMRVSLHDAVADLNREVAERRAAEVALAETNVKLERSVSILERGARDQALVHRMSEMLQTGLSLAEGYRLVAYFASEMFPDTSGAVYASIRSTRLLERLGTWGDDSGIEEVFRPDECWALRTGEAVLTADPEHDLRCEHAKRAGARWCACYPLSGHTGALGLLYVQWPDAETMRDVQQEAARAFASRAALALLNLRLQESLREQSTRDPLTGVFNRRYMEESLDREIAGSARSGSPLAVIMVDADRFKQVNDVHGHATGDRLLMRLAQLLLAESRGSDIVCRYGGEEFVLIWPGIDRESAVRRAEEIRLRTHALSRGLGEEIELSVSIGVAMYPEDGAGADALIGAADAAMYSAKDHGRDRVASPEHTEE